MSHLTPALISAAGRDAGNLSMRKAGRIQWNREDLDAAHAVTTPLWESLQPAL